jgi:outer membrane protein insertion porin family
MPRPERGAATVSPRCRRGVLLLVAFAALAGRAAAEVRLDALAPFAGRRIDAIDLEGHRVTREDVIRREIRSAPGQPLDPALVMEDVQRLDNLSIFAEIDVEAQASGEDARLRFVLKEMPAWIPWVGFSYTEQDGFSVGPKLSALNLMGRAMSVSAKAYFGGAKSYSLKATWPWINGNHRSLDFYGARLTRTDTLNDFKETSYEFTPQAGTWLGEHGRLQGKFSLFRLESDTDGKTLDDDNQDVLARFGASAGWDTRDSWRFPRTGTLADLELWRTTGDGDFWSANLDLRQWIPVGRRGRLLLSGLASLQTGTVGEDVPVYLIYRLGGANSIRGYSIDDLGRRLYGKNQMLGTVEYSRNLIPLRRWDIWKFALSLGLDLAVFTDVGIAWTESRELAADRARAGTGAGLRLLVPGAEMVRFDVGWSADGGFHFHFASGTKPVAQRARIR